MPFTDCPGAGKRWEVLRFDGIAQESLGYIATRCNNPPGDGSDVITPLKGLAFDPTLGRLYLLLRTHCGGSSCSVSGGPVPSYYGRWIAAISGFTTTFEILQTYTPASGPISFRVPYMPEGFPAADYFDTYYGDLATVGDWSQAQPLQCGYPATVPSVGDYLEVADPLPNPEPGHGRYYVTAVTHQGQRRYGRKSSGGVLSGRDPAVLPTCGQ